MKSLHPSSIRLAKPASDEWARFVCRPALPSDTTGVLALARLIWDGHDYIPFVWKDWMNDSSSLTAIGEYGGKIIGLVRMSIFPGSQGWVQGLRVHPDFRGRGFAGHLMDYALEFYKKSNLGPVRLYTSSERFVVHHLSRQRGFELLQRVSFYHADPTNDQCDNFELVQESDFAHAWKILNDYSLLPPAQNLSDLGWMRVTLTREILSQAIRENRVWWQPDVPAIVIYTDDWNDLNQKGALIGSIACHNAGLPALLLDLRRMTHRMHFNFVSWAIPMDFGLEESAVAAGFSTPPEEEILFLFEKRVSA